MQFLKCLILTICRNAYHGIHRSPFDFASHPLAPCGTLVVIHNSIRETWDNFGLIGFYLGPSLNNYRSYRCLIQDTMKIRTTDSIILYPAPLVVPGASRFDQLLAITSNLHDLANKEIEVIHGQRSAPHFKRAPNTRHCLHTSSSIFRHWTRPRRMDIQRTDAWTLHRIIHRHTTR